MCRRNDHIREQEDDRKEHAQQHYSEARARLDEAKQRVAVVTLDDPDQAAGGENPPRIAEATSIPKASDDEKIFAYRNSASQGRVKTLELLPKWLKYAKLSHASTTQKGCTSARVMMKVR